MIELWCNIEGRRNIFNVFISPASKIHNLRSQIYNEERIEFMVPCSPSDLTLTKIDADYNMETEKRVNAGEYRPSSNDQVLKPMDTISEVWPRPPLHCHLHVLVGLPTRESARAIPRWSTHLDNDQRPAKRSRVVPSDMSKLYVLADELYKAMWRQDLESKLQDVEGCNGLKYLPAAAVNNLRLRELGCFAEAIFVREEYCSTFSALEERQDNSGGTVLTGHPRIGKSVFLYYILLRRLSEGKPVALECGPGFFVFREDGVEVHETNSAGFFNSEEKTWVLTDSTERSRNPCNAFQRASQMERAWIILTTSPVIERYNRLLKECELGVFIMDCLTREEARALSIIHGFGTGSFLVNFDKWGPSTPTCLQLTRGSLTENRLESRVEKAAEKFANNPSAINMEGNAEVESHLLFTTFSIAPGRDVFALRVATSHLRGFVVKAVAKIDAAKQKFYYIWLSSDPDNPNNKLSCTASPRSVRSTASTTHERNSLYLQPVGYENVIVHRGEAGQDGYKSANRRQIPFAWIPASRSDASFDAVMCTDNDIITIHVTVAATHSVKAKGFEGLKKNIPKEFHESRRWSHVFVTDNEDTAAKLGRKKYTVADEMGIPINVYTAVLDISLFQYDPEVLKRAEVPQDQNEVGRIGMDIDAEGEEQVGVMPLNTANEVGCPE